MSLTVKVFFERANGSKEIRRFPFSTGPRGLVSFSLMKDKIKQLYPLLANGNFNLYWQDPDGDRVAFSTDEELKDAFDYVNDGVLRVYIPEPMEEADVSSEKSVPPSSSQSQGTSQQQQQQQQQQQSQDKCGASPGQKAPPKPEGPPQVHVGITCDGCEGPVIGVRFKCCICPDYDLCQTCEGRGKHVEHDMYKITTPRVNPLSFLPPHMGRFLNRYMRNMTQDAGATAGAGGSATFCSSGARSGGASASANASAQAGGAGYDAGEGRAKERADYDNLLRNVGANIAAFLDPFGIDVSYDVHHNGTSARSGQFRQGFGAGMGAGVHCPMFNSEARKAGGAQASAENTSDTAQTSEKQAPSASEPAATQMETEEEAPRSEAPGSGQPKKCGSSNGSEEGWTMVDDEPASPPTGAIPMPAPEPTPPQTSAPAETSAPTPPPRPTVGPNGDAAQANIYPNLRIQESVEHMLAMGFTNTDGWLTELLTQSGGDIGTALDTIKARATQQLQNLRQ